MVCITAGAFVGGKLIGRTGHYKRFVVAGLPGSAGLWQIRFDLWARLGLGFAGIRAWSGAAGAVGGGAKCPAAGRSRHRHVPVQLRRELGGAVGVAICAVLFHAARRQQAAVQFTAWSRAELAGAPSWDQAPSFLSALSPPPPQAWSGPCWHLKRHELASKLAERSAVQEY